MWPALTLASALKTWPRPRGLSGLDLGRRVLASTSALASAFWPRLTSLVTTAIRLRFDGCSTACQRSLRS